MKKQEFNRKSSRLEIRKGIATNKTNNKRKGSRVWMDHSARFVTKTMEVDASLRGNCATTAENLVRTPINSRNPRAQKQEMEGTFLLQKHSSDGYFG